MPNYKYIYRQLPPRDPRLFLSYGDARMICGSVNLERYRDAHTGGVEAPSPEQACEALYTAFNVPRLRPQGYAGRAMSVSDVVSLWDTSVEPPLRTDWYCDTIGFERMEGED